jgi:hypothetical protein
MSRLTGNTPNFILMQIFILTVLNVTRVEENHIKAQQKSRAPMGHGSRREAKIKA